MSVWQVHNLDVFDAIGELDDRSVHLLLTDPPYFRVKDEPWDRAWDSPGGFLDWMGDWMAAARPTLSPRGTVVVFTSPQMFGRVEQRVAESFAVFGNVVWAKGGGPGRMGSVDLGSLRGPWPLSERVVFAEPFEGTSGWMAAVDGVRGEVFEPLRAYIADDFARAGVTPSQVADFMGVSQTMISQHYLSRSQWHMPTPAAYQKMREALHALNGGGEYLRRDYEELRRDYEELRRDYEELRRRWNSDGHTWQALSDVWTYPTVKQGPGRHSCEKPLPLLRHIVELTTDPGDHVVDLFAGSGSTGEAALTLGRTFTGNDASAKWATVAADRCRWATGQNSYPDMVPAATGEPVQLRL